MMRGTTRFLATLAAASMLGICPLHAFDAVAQEGPPPIPDAIVAKMLELGLKNIDHATCDGFNQCAPATPQEFKYPPISNELARAAILVGTRTAVARWCGLDADRRSVVPMMQRLRKLRLDNRQMALAAVIHGIQVSILSEQLKAKGPCDAKTRTKIDAELPKPGGKDG